MLTSKNICACIITYNPDIDRLIENVKSIVCQVDCLIIIDNGSNNCPAFITELLKSGITNLTIKTLGENKGIAEALNVGCSFAVNKRYEWLLTLDQDSVSLPNLIGNYLRFLNDSNNGIERVGQLSCLIKDRNITNESFDNSLPAYNEIEWCITSGSLVRISAWQEIGGFDSRLFIDGVDKDFCLSLSEAGYKTFRINCYGLLHEVGKISRIISLFGKKHPVYNHSPFRKYYISRNAIIIARKHNSVDLSLEIKRVRKRMLFELIFEKQKIKKYKASRRGLKDGLVFPLDSKL